jgi:methionine-rich copper-binding protein CopC
MHFRKITGAAGLALAVALLAVPAAVAAHAELVSSDPAAGAKLDKAPTEVTLTFNNEIDPEGSSFEVTDADGTVVGNGAIDLTVADRNVMRGDVTITDPGVYTVSWTSVALDGDKLTGTFSFGYATDQKVPKATGGEDEVGPDTAMPAPSGSGAPLVAFGIGLVLVSGGLAVRRGVIR